MFTVYQKNIDKDLYQVKSRRALNKLAFVPMELGFSIILAHACVYQPRSPPNHIVMGFL